MLISILFYFYNFINFFLNRQKVLKVLVKDIQKHIQHADVVVKYHFINKRKLVQHVHIQQLKHVVMNGVVKLREEEQLELVE